VEERGIESKLDWIFDGRYHEATKSIFDVVVHQNGSQPLSSHPPRSHRREKSVLFIGVEVL